jgi:hypothetical protein
MMMMMMRNYKMSHLDGLNVAVVDVIVHQLVEVSADYYYYLHTADCYSMMVFDDAYYDLKRLWVVKAAG